MRQDFPVFPAIEALEGRRLMSTSVFLGIDCLPHGGAQTPVTSPVEGSGGDVVKGHGESDQDPTPAFPPIETVIPQVTGKWSGSQVKGDDSLGAQLSLVVSSPAPGELNATLDLHGARRIRWTGQLMYNQDTGHLTMYYLSGSLIAKLDATLATDANNGKLELDGTFTYVTLDATYTAAVTLHHTGS